MLYRICKSFRFEAAHQLDRAFTKKCVDTVHGHSFVVELRLTSIALDGNLMVLDFGLLHTFIEEVLSEWDHALLLTKTRAQDYAGTPNVRIFITPANPTAELLASLLYNKLHAALDDPSITNGLRVEAVRVHESPTSWAECCPPKEE